MRVPRLPLLLVLTAAALGPGVPRAELLGLPARIDTGETSGARLPVTAANASRRIVVYRGPTGNYGGFFGRFVDLAGNPLGSEFKAWDFPPNVPFAQVYAYGQHHVGIDAAGNAVLVFQAGDAFHAPDGSCTAILGQRLDATGARVGTEFQVSSSGSGCQASPRVAMQSDGSFLVAWDFYTPFSTGPGIFARRFDAAGAPVGGDFRVGGDLSADDVQPEIAADGAGGYALAWLGNGLRFRHLTASGTPATPEVLVATGTGRGALAVDPAGDVLLAWQGTVPGVGHVIMARHLDAAGNPTGPELQVNTVPRWESTDEENPAVHGDPYVVAMGGGRFLVAWADQFPDTSGVSMDLFGAMVAAPGVLERGQIQLASGSIWDDPDHAQPVGGGDSAGGALLLWEDSFATPGTWTPFMRGVFAQRVGAVCPPSPLAGCRAGAAGKGSLLLKRGPDRTRDSLVWKWGRGSATPADFGDPLASTSFALCLYDATGAPVLAATAPAAGACAGGRPCWSQAGSGDALKRKYKNTDKPPLPGGISLLTLAAAAPGKASIKLKGAGLNLYSVPGLPLDQSAPIRAQLVNDTSGVCFEAVYSAPAVTSATQFKDTND